MQELRQKVEELEAKLGKHKSITCLFVVNYLKIMHHSYRPCLKFLEDLTTKLDRPAPKMFTGHTKLLLRLTEPPNRTFCEIFVAIILSPDDLQWFWCEFNQGSGAGARNDGAAIVGGAGAAFKIYPETELFSKFSWSRSWWLI